MSFKALLHRWDETPEIPLTAEEYTLRLRLEDAARVEALAEMFPGIGREQILMDLLGSALDELAESMPYVAGDRIISEDEFGDPIYEDAGRTPRFIELTRKHLARLTPRG